MQKAPAIHLWLVLWKAHDALREHAVRDISATGLGFSDFAVLEALLHKGPMPVNAIGPKVCLTPGSISVAIDRLERKALVERKLDPDDRRARIVHLTADGCALIGGAFAGHEAAMARAVSGLSAVERAEAVKLLRKLGKKARLLLDESDARLKASNIQ